MNHSGAFRQQLVLWGLILGLWCLLVLAFAGQLMSQEPITTTTAIGAALRDWLPWLPLSPVVIWLALRFPLERQRLLLSVPVHLAACLLAVALCALIGIQGRPAGRPFVRPQGGLREGPPEGFPPPGSEGGPPEGFPPGGPGRPEGFPPGPGPLRARGPVAPANPYLHAFLLQSRFSVPFYWVVVSLVHAFGYARRFQERETKAAELEARLTTARLEALRMQLHPHFLFNTLNAISTLVHRDPKAADEMIVNLSELLRATLDTSEQEIPLSRELEFLDRYLEIQQARFGDRLLVEKEIDATALESRVPTLILQPLVENAVRHGIEPQTAPGVIRIRARRDGSTLRLTVQDTGTVTGAKPAARQREGIGLPNTRARLQELYGDLGRMTLTNGVEGGFQVELEFPCRTAATSPQVHAQTAT